MRLNRKPGRAPSRRGGCLSFMVLLALMFGVAYAAWAWLDTRFERDPATDAAESLRQAGAAFARGDLDTAVAAAEQSWQADSGVANVDALLMLARSLIYRSYDDYDRDYDRLQALNVTSAAYERLRTNPDVTAIHAFVLTANDQPVRAARLAESVLRDDPDHVPARIARALGYKGAGGFEVALQEAQRATNTDSDWRMDALRVVALSYGDLGRYDEAAAAVEEAITLNTRLLALHFERALYALQTGDTDSATAAYFRVLAFDPDNIKARLRMCELSTLLRESEPALDYCTQVTQQAPDWADGWYRLGREHFLRGEYAPAQAAFNQCTRLQIAQDIPIEQRELDCWYLQGQSAEIVGDCPGLLRVYNQFRAMAAEANLPQTWTYPPEGPPVCLDG